MANLSGQQPNHIPPPLGSSALIGQIREYELHAGIPEFSIPQILELSNDPNDIALWSNTSDARRFVNRETLADWYADTGRCVVTLNSTNGEIVGLWFGRPALPPTIDTVENAELKNLLDANEKRIHTAGVRIYPNFRGKWLAEPLIRGGIGLYRSIYPDAYICIDIDAENIASQTAFGRCGFEFVGYGENQKSVSGKWKKRGIYLQTPREE